MRFLKRLLKTIRNSEQRRKNYPWTGGNVFTEGRGGGRSCGESKEQNGKQESSGSSLLLSSIFLWNRSYHLLPCTKQLHQLGKYMIIIQLKKRPNNPRQTEKQGIEFLGIAEISTKPVFYSYSLKALTFSTFIFQFITLITNIHRE